MSEKKDVQEQVADRVSLLSHIVAKERARGATGSRNGEFLLIFGALQDLYKRIEHVSSGGRPC